VQVNHGFEVNSRRFAECLNWCPADHDVATSIAVVYGSGAEDCLRPYIFQLPDWLPIGAGRPLFSYGVALGLSFILGWSLCVHFSRRDGIDSRIASTGMFVIVVTSLIGARAMHFVSSPLAKFSIANFFKFDEGGLVAYGGMIAGLAGCWTYTTWRRVDGWAYWDNCAPGLALGLGVTRIGCFLFGCDYGVRTESAWALRFPRWDAPEVAAYIKRHSPAFSDQYRTMPDSVAQLSEAVHATQLYESLAGFLAFAILLMWRPAKKFHGQIMLVFLGYYGIARYFIEEYRGDADRGENVIVWLSTSQLTSVMILAVVAGLWWYLSNRGLYAASGTTAWNPPSTGTEHKRRKTKRKNAKKSSS